jgi:hypothetical protein
VRKQPSPNGAEMGGVKPLIDPSRLYDRHGNQIEFPSSAPMEPREVIEFR